MTAVDPLTDVLRRYAEGSRRLGSPMGAALMAGAAEDAAAGGPVARIVRAQAGPDVTYQQLSDAGTPLRLLGTVHRMVLEGRLPDLARHYPTAVPGHGPGDPVTPERDPLEAWPAFRAALEAHADDVVDGMAGPPQTNEVGRAAVLLGGLAAALATTPLPVRLFEVGSSAGLNLLVDRFRLELADGTGLGPTDSPVRLHGPWDPGTGPDLDVPLEIVERSGCDVVPLDALDRDDGLRLHAYTWPDQPERHRRLAGALALARTTHPPVHRRSAPTHVADVWPLTGTLTVVWHSIVTQYLDDATRAAFDAEVARLGRRATADAPVAHLWVEPEAATDGSGRFAVGLRTWPDGDERDLGDAHPHGTWVRWR